MKRRVKKNDKVKPLLKGAEEIGFSEKDAVVEDLRDTGDMRDCIGEGEFEEDGVVSRIRLF